MPELPEIETVVNALKKIVTHKKIKNVYLGNKGLRRPFPVNFKEKVIGKTLGKPFRRAKYCLLPLEEKQWVLIHLGMSGQIRILNKKPVLSKHDHVMISLTGGIYIMLTDPRRFGCLDLIQSNLHDNPSLKYLGPEPLTNSFNYNYLYNAIKNKKSVIKSILLDQKIIAGLGNIYVNEALYESKVSPRRLGKNISKKNIELIVNSIKEILEKSIKVGGTSLKDHIQPDGSLGYYKNELLVYGKINHKCHFCGSRIKKINQSGRSSFYCPKCQR